MIESPRPDADIVRAICAVRLGDRKAFAVVVEKYHRSIMNLAAAILFNHEAAIELTQDVFVRAYEQLSKFDVSRSMLPWLLTITYRLGCDEQRRLKSQAKGTSELFDEARVRSTHSPSSLSLAMERERSQILWGAVSLLPEAERVAALSFYKYGLSTQEIADAMEITVGTVKTYLFRAREHLRSSLAPHADLKG